MFPRAATRDAARVLGHEYAIGDRLAKLIPDPQQGRPPSFAECLPPGQELANEVATRPDGEADRRRRAGPRGDRPQRVDPRRRRRHLRPRPDRHRPAPARRRGHGRGRREGLPHGHAVLDEAHRGDRPPQDGLPRPAQPRRHRGRAGHHRALDGRAAGHDDAAARRREDLRDDGARATRSACSSSSPRACARRSRRSGRREFEDLVALVALYRPGAMDQIPTYARGKRNPESITFIDDRLRPITESTKGVILYQEQAMQIAKSLAGFSGPKADDLRKAIGKKNREAMAKLKPEFFEGCRASGHVTGRDRDAVGDEREVRRLLLQQVARRLLRADLLPDRVAEGELPRRVHGRADQLGHGHEGQGPVLRQPGRGDGDRDPPARRQPVRPRVRRRRGQHPLRARRREGRRLRGGRGDQGGARRTASSPRCGTSASASTAAP